MAKYVTGLVDGRRHEVLPDTTFTYNEVQLVVIAVVDHGRETVGIAEADSLAHMGFMHLDVTRWMRSGTTETWNPSGGNFE